MKHLKQPKRRDTRADLEEVLVIDSTHGEVWDAIKNQCQSDNTQCVTKDNSLTIQFHNQKDVRNSVDRIEISCNPDSSNTSLKIGSWLNEETLRCRLTCGVFLSLSLFLLTLLSRSLRLIEGETIKLVLGAGLFFFFIVFYLKTLMKVIRTPQYGRWALGLLEKIAVARGWTLILRCRKKWSSWPRKFEVQILFQPIALLAGVIIGDVLFRELGDERSGTIVGLMGIAIIVAGVATIVGRGLRRLNPDEELRHYAVSTIFFFKFVIVALPVTAIVLSGKYNTIHFGWNRLGEMNSFFVVMFYLCALAALVAIGVFAIVSLRHQVKSVQTEYAKRLGVWKSESKGFLARGGWFTVALAVCLGAATWLMVWHCLLVIGWLLGSTETFGLPGGHFRLFAEDREAVPVVTASIVFGLAMVVLLAQPIVYVAAHIGVNAWNRMRGKTGHDVASGVESELVRKVWTGMGQGGARELNVGFLNSQRVEVVSVPRFFKERPGWILVSSGAKKTLSERELEGIIAHEVCHILKHRNYILGSDLMSVTCCVGYGFLSVTVDWQKLEEEADRRAVDYMLRKYGTADDLVAGLRKAKDRNSIIGILGKVKYDCGFRLNFFSHLQTYAKRNRILNWLLWWTNLYYFTGMVGYQHPSTERRIRAITEYASLRQ